MIDGKTKQKLLKELEKSGNAYLSCLKIGIDRSTFYRWKDSDKNFRKRADKAIYQGRENMSDIAEHALLLNVKDKKMDAIKYVLGHNSLRYKQKQTSNVVILHKKDALSPSLRPKSLEDILDEEEKDAHVYALELQERFVCFGKKLPNKPDGSPMELDDLPNYKTYIEDWQKCRTREEQAEAVRKFRGENTTISNTGTADSKSVMDMPTTTPQENQTPSDSSGSDSATPDKKPGNNT